MGAAGSGKTTLARRLFGDAEILSSDALRAALGGDPADQRMTRPAFAILHREVAARLGAGRLVVTDATNVEPTARRSLLRIATRAGAPAIAIVLALPPGEVHGRNAARPGRVVPPGIVDRHLGRLGRLGEPASMAARLVGEGFAAVHVLTSGAELDAVAIVRPDGSVSRP